MILYRARGAGGGPCPNNTAKQNRKDAKQIRCPIELIAYLLIATGSIEIHMIFKGNNRNYNEHQNNSNNTYYYYFTIINKLCNIY